MRELRLLAAHADLVGMTMASECIVAGELGLSYAAVCVVVNHAAGRGDSAENGIAGSSDTLTMRTMGNRAHDSARTQPPERGRPSSAAVSREVR